MCHFTCKKKVKNWARDNLLQEDEKAYLNHVFRDISDSDPSNDLTCPFPADKKVLRQCFRCQIN